jgi:hypothetical protein
VQIRAPLSVRWPVAAAVMVAGSLIVVPALAEKPIEALPGPVTTTVTAIPIDFDRSNPDRKNFGKLIFRSGLNLYAKTRHFGGYSGIVLDASGRSLLAISDAGGWMRATLDYDGRRLRRLSDVVLGPMLGADGKPLKEEAERDAEGVTLVDGDARRGTVFVSFERKHRIVRYPFTAERFGPPDGTVPLPAGAKAMVANRGIEAMALIKAGKLKGTLLAFAEGRADKNGNLIGWLIGGPTPGGITLKRIGGFDITDATPLSDGGVVLLERRFRFSEGIKMRVRRLHASEIRRGALMQGEVLLEANDSLNIDNMEAVAAHQAASGETILTLMSDDNFSALQRTLIMQFSMPETTPVVAGPRR